MGKKRKKGKHPKAQKGHPQDPVAAKKHLGQHFLKDKQVAQKIADTLSLEGYRDVLEIGPGTGVLTQFLLPKDIRLVAMDLDTESVAYLNSSFFVDHPELLKEGQKLQILEADFLNHDLTTLFGDRPFAITGNFPYNISTQIVFKMLEHLEQIPEFTGMFQKEVAQRICATEGSKIYGILSVLTQAYYDAEYLFTVPPDVFSPPPKVDSGVLRLRRKADMDLGCDPKLFKQVVKMAFNLRRKTLRNSLKSLELSDFLKEDTIFDRRPEQLAVTDFIALTNKIAHDTL